MEKGWGKYTWHGASCVDAIKQHTYSMLVGMPGQTVDMEELVLTYFFPSVKACLVLAAFIAE